MFEAEAAGLAELARADALRVPVPVCSGQAGDDAFLVLEYLELGGDMARAAEQLGHGLAALHRASAARFGWHRANTIGATPQLNDWCIDWIEFWRERRLRVQLELAAARGARQLSQLGERLLEVLPEFFHDYRPAVSLLHGDLWSGNAAATVDGTPVLFDPAVYFGDRETDVAMTELFGGFPPRFHAAYRASWPVDPGYRVRKSLYNLYHVINHFNLFGGGYLDQAERMVQRLLSARS
jgi:fructosamine-3-kinase